MQENLKSQLYKELKEQGDPRILGEGDIFDQYQDASSAAGFYERYMSGEKVPAGWVNESDFESVEKAMN